MYSAGDATAGGGGLGLGFGLGFGFGLGLGCRWRAWWRRCRGVEGVVVGVVVVGVVVVGVVGVVDVGVVDVGVVVVAGVVAVGVAVACRATAGVTLNPQTASAPMVASARIRPTAPRSCIA
jgi:hypothetical protein